MTPSLSDSPGRRAAAPLAPVMHMMTANMLIAHYYAYCTITLLFMCEPVGIRVTATPFAAGCVLLLCATSIAVALRLAHGRIRGAGFARAIASAWSDGAVRVDSLLLVSLAAYAMFRALTERMSSDHPQVAWYCGLLTVSAGCQLATTAAALAGIGCRRRAISAVD